MVHSYNRYSTGTAVYLGTFIYSDAVQVQPWLSYNGMPYAGTLLWYNGTTITMLQNSMFTEFSPIILAFRYMTHSSFIHGVSYIIGVSRNSETCSFEITTIKGSGTLGEV